MGEIHCWPLMLTNLALTHLCRRADGVSYHRKCVEPGVWLCRCVAGIAGIMRSTELLTAHALLAAVYHTRCARGSSPHTLCVRQLTAHLPPRCPLPF